MSESDSHVGGDTTISRNDEGGDREVHIRRGAEVDRYVVIDRLGSGAMGAVYSAFDPRLDRQVAVKLLRHRKDRALEDLLDEARALARLSHPNVVSVFDAGVFGENVFITMEKVVGHTLDRWARTTPKPGWRECLGVLLGAGRGLAAAHAAGTIHRDFKPKNVMVAESGLTKVMDFGLAALADDPPRPETGNGLMVEGTPLYMAPEQHAGRVSFASDQYAFCLVAYEVLGGTHPRRGVRSLTALREALRDELPPLTCPGLPPSVRAAIMRGLSPSPQARWPSMDALLEVLSKALRGRGSRWVGAVTVAGLVGVAWFAASAREPDPCPDPADTASSLVPAANRDEISSMLESFDATYGVQRAVLVTAGIDRYANEWAKSDTRACELQRATPLAKEHEGTRACLERHRHDFLGAVAVLRTAEGVEQVRAADLLEGLPDPRACLEDDVPERGVAPPPEDVTESVAELRIELAELRAKSAVGRWVEVSERIGSVLESARALDYQPLVAEALLVQGNAAQLLHAIDDAESALTDAVFIALEYGDRRLALEASLSLVALRRELSQTDLNRAWAVRARRLISAGSDPSVEAELEIHLSVAMRNIGEFVEARKHAEFAVDVMRKVHGEEHRRYADARHVLGAALFRQHEKDAALKLARENLALRERLLGPRHPSVAASLLLLGVVHGGRDEFDEAEAAYLRAIDVQKTVVGSRSRVLAGLYSNLGGLYGRMGQPERGRDMVALAIDIWRERNQIDSLVYGLNAMGGLALRLHDCTEMLAVYSEAWSLLEATGGPHPIRSRIGLGIGASHLCAGDFSSAAPWLRRADEADDFPPTVERMNDLWQALLAAHEGDQEKAQRRAALARASTESISLPQRWWDALDEAAPEG